MSNGRIKGGLEALPLAASSHSVLKNDRFCKSRTLDRDLIGLALLQGPNANISNSKTRPIPAPKNGAK